MVPMNRLPRPRDLSRNPARQKGVLMVVTLIMLLVITMLGMATVDTSGLEMRMASNSRQQQQVFEAAEYTLSWVENNIRTNGYFSDTQLGNTSCGSTCFSSACTNGYCFNGTYNTSTLACTLTVPATEPAANAAIWTTGSGKHRTLVIPNTGLTTKYIIEHWCFTSRDSSLPKDTNNALNAHVYRITALATGEDGRARVMLRSTIRAI